MKKDGKKLLFEMMEKINPDFKNVNEITADVARTQQVSTPTAQRANANIDTPQDFKGWFQTQFATTGFDPQNKPISISQVQGIVRDVLLGLGYK